MWKCPRCRANIPNDKVICPTCGHLQAAEVDVEQPPLPSITPASLMKPLDISPTAIKRTRMISRITTWGDIMGLASTIAALLLGTVASFFNYVPSLFDLVVISFFALAIFFAGLFFRTLSHCLAEILRSVSEIVATQSAVRDDTPAERS